MGILTQHASSLVVDRREAYVVLSVALLDDGYSCNGSKDDSHDDDRECDHKGEVGDLGFGVWSVAADDGVRSKVGCERAILERVARLIHIGDPSGFTVASEALRIEGSVRAAADVVDKLRRWGRNCWWVYVTGSRRRARGGKRGRRRRRGRSRHDSGLANAGRCVVQVSGSLVFGDTIDRITYASSVIPHLIDSTR